jgi:type IV pilus assembly protein PilE
MKHRARRQAGFTLIELMISVAIVAILAGVAYPAYTSQIAKGRRAEARTAMLDGAQWMERFYSENYRYDKNTATVATGTLFAAQYSQVPSSGSANYTLSLENLATATFRMVATRSGSMASDDCGDYLLTQAGAKGLRNYSTSRYSSEAAAVKACW